MLWVDSTDLKDWATRRDCQGHLPLLIRRLIRATAPDISKIHFPAEDGVSSPGWDGILEVFEGTEYIPKGVSVWEMGCNRDVKGKADSDYEKRKENLSSINPSETTFVFVSPRAWTKSEEWCEEKRKEGIWKDVRAYNAATLEEWIEQAPAVGIQLGQRLGKYPKGVKALVDWWDEWNMGTTPHLTAELVLAGRDKQVEDIHEKLKSSSSKITVQATTIDESIAFLAAAINSLPEEEREFYLSRCVVINDSEAFGHISITGKSKLLLVPEFEEIQGLSLAIQKGHSVYIPVGPDNNIANLEINLPRLGRDAFISALEKMGLSNEDSQKYSRNTGRSITVLRRQLMDHANQPKWAKSNSARDIIPALLAGRWIESNNRDKEVISQIAGETYDSFSTKLYSWRNQQDSPVLKIGELWRLISPMDAFFALAPFITPSDLQKLKDIVLKVFKTLDPALELEPEERWIAAVHGKVQSYSNELRKGILQTLILIAVFGGNAKISLLTSAQTWVDNVISELLYDADCNLWNSFSDVLPLIAEASPKSFMDAIESSLYGDEKHIMCLFEEKHGFMGPSANHSSLLWALEHLSWSPELLSRVTLILGKLAKYDPNSESRMINRPENSLRDIFLLWHPQTYASLKERLDILDLLIKEYPEVGWNLLVDLMPKNHDTVDLKSKTIWRQFSEKTKVQVTISEHYSSVKEIINRLLIHVEYDEHKWVKLLNNFPALPADERNRIIEQLSSSADNISDKDNELWNKLREIISRHRSYPETDWALPEEDLKGLEEIYISLEPNNAIDRFIWLFDEYRPNLIQGIRRGNHHEEQKIFLQLRSDALNTIRKEYGFEGLLNLAKRTKNPGILGEVFVKEDINSKEEEEFYSLLEDQDKSLMIFVQTYIFRKAFDNKKWIKNIVKKAQLDNWSNTRVVNLFIAFPSRMVVWNLLKLFNKEIREAYWKRCRFGGITNENEDKIYYLKHMLQVKRYFTALDIASLYSEEINPELIAEILEKAAIEKSEDEFRIEHYEIENLFEELYKSDYPKNEISKLEWFYLPFLAGVGSQKPPKLLHDELTNNPEFFAEVIKNVYKREDEKNDEEQENLSPELLKQKAKLSSQLLRSWNGTFSNADIQLDYERLESWVDAARNLCKQSDRIKACDRNIGKLLAHAKPEGDMWPPEAVCEVIDRIESNDLHRNFKTGIINNRGTYTKSWDEGGQQEVELSKKFRNYASKLNTRFPRTASILNSIADDYENDARREDDEVEIRDLDQ